MKNDTRFSLNATSLRLLAMVLMLIDHMGALLFPGAIWMRCVGRLAFPIFAFQTVQGYRHTRNFRRYCGRLLIFGLISEIPFDLMLSGSPISLLNQNVMFTLLLGLWAIRAWEQKRFVRLVLIFVLTIFTFPDYGMLGVLTVLQFHLFRDNPLFQLGAMALIHGIGYGGIQTFAVAAMIPIVLYNGEKGPGGRAFQYIAYAFYPAHMLLLALL